MRIGAWKLAGRWDGRNLALIEAMDWARLPDVRTDLRAGL
jgi:hypothetical protein